MQINLWLDVTDEYREWNRVDKNTGEITGKNRRQEAFAYIGKLHPVPVQLPVEKKIPAGEYSIDLTELLHVGRFGNLELNPFEPWDKRIVER